MDNMENNNISIERDSEIKVVIDNPHWDDEGINLGRVFYNMKKKYHIYAWVIVLCILVGICIPLISYQFTKKQLTVSSVVTLNYTFLDKDDRGEEIEVPVIDLTAPDGTELDLNQITSSYIIQTALDGLSLSFPVSAEQIRSNITIERILTEESRRQQEVAANMIEQKNTGAYTQVREIDLKYTNQFVVSLKNGFGDEESRVKTELRYEELQLILNRILSAYNNYLVKTYVDIQLPDDEISVIDTENLDILDSVEQLRTAAQNLYNYCDEKPDSIKTYRSYQNGYSLYDWMEILQTVREVNIDYLYSYVYTNSIIKDKDSMITNYQYQLRNAETELDVVNRNIATVKAILETYQNDDIFVSMQESDSAKTTQTTTDYYNNMILKQAENYSKAAKLETTIADLQNKIISLQTNSSSVRAEIELLRTTNAELTSAVSITYRVFQEIRNHMQELMSTPFYTTYVEYSTAHGKTISFLVASVKNICIGGAAGVLTACGLWFLSGFIPEFLGKEKEKERRVER